MYNCIFSDVELPSLNYNDNPTRTIAAALNQVSLLEGHVKQLEDLYVSTFI